jgi:hypothetical protein
LAGITILVQTQDSGPAPGLTPPEGVG